MAKRKILNNSLAIVTGAAGGIGLQFALELAARGSSLLLIDIDEKRLREAESLISKEEILGKVSSVNIYLLTLDLTSHNFLECLDNFCKGKNLHPDILINNAGIFSFRPIKDTSERRIEIFVDLHIRAVTMLSRWFISIRSEFKTGYLLNMSSMSCWMPMPGLAMYAATKSYIRVFSRSLHYEVKDLGIGVTVACPGGIATDLFGLPENLKKLAVNIKVLDTPERFVSKAIDRMLSKRKQYINGWLNRFSIFFMGIMPTWVRMLVKRHLLDKGIQR